MWRPQWYHPAERCCEVLFQKPTAGEKVGHAPADQTRFSPKRARLRRKVLAFSFSFAVVTLLLVGALFAAIKLYFPLRELQETNQKTFQSIRCDAEACDVTALANDWEFTGPDYLLDKHTYFLLDIEPSAAELSGFSLHYSDPAFIKQFQTPASVSTPAGESWRLFSAMRQAGSSRVAVMVGYAKKVSWKMDLPSPPDSLIDDKLRQELLRIESALEEDSGHVQLPSAVSRKIAADGYEVVDLTTDEILGGGYQIPVYFPRGRPLPSEGTSFFRNKGNLYLVRTDANERLLAVSSYLVGDLRSLAALFLLLFVVSGIVAYISGKTFLRKYFLFRGTRPHTAEEALKLGEGPSIEFKRNISFASENSTEEMLRSVAAFANTGDGAIFIGIDDLGKITGIEADSPKEKDRLSQRVYQLVGQRIRPTPSVQVDFVDVRGFTLCRVFVPRGEEPLHFVDGVIYVRYGSSDIKAQPEIVRRLLAEYAF